MHDDEQPADPVTSQNRARAEISKQGATTGTLPNWLQSGQQVYRAAPGHAIPVFPFGDWPSHRLKASEAIVGDVDVIADFLERRDGSSG